MNHRFVRGASALLLAAALCCSAFSLTGCAGSSSDDELSIAYAPKVPDSKIDASVPGDDLRLGIGETVSYQNKLNVTLNRVVELDSAATTSNRMLCAEITIANVSGAAVDCTTLTHFRGEIDGEEAPDIQNISAGIFARKYYTAIQSPLQAFNQEIAAGETLSGYVYLYVPTAWKTLSVIYTPYKYYSNDTITFTIDEAKLTHYTEHLA